MSDIDFVNKYLKDFLSLLKPYNDFVNTNNGTRDILVTTHKNNNK